MYVPNKDIEAFSRKYMLAFLVYLAVWVAGTYVFWLLYQVTNAYFSARPEPQFQVGLHLFTLGFVPLLVWLPFYWPLILMWCPIQFTPYWEKPEYKSQLDANPPW